MKYTRGAGGDRISDLALRIQGNRAVAPWILRPRSSMLHSMPHLRSVSLRGEPTNDRFPYSVPIIRQMPELAVSPTVTFLVGENGSGKSTLLEGIAAAAQLPTVGSESVDRDPTICRVFALRQKRERHPYPARVVCCDVRDGALGAARFDLITVVGSTLAESGDRGATLRALQGHVAPGGELLVAEVGQGAHGDRVRTCGDVWLACSTRAVLPPST